MLHRHACSMMPPPALLPCLQDRSTLGACGLWPGPMSAPHGMVSIYALVTEFGRISARFAARLIRADALTVLESLAPEALRQSGGVHSAGAPLGPARLEGLLWLHACACEHTVPVLAPGLSTQQLQSAVLQG